MIFKPISQGGNVLSSIDSLEMKESCILTIAASPSEMFAIIEGPDVILSLKDEPITMIRWNCALCITLIPRSPERKILVEMFMRKWWHEYLRLTQKQKQ